MSACELELPCASVSVAVDAFKCTSCAKVLYIGECVYCKYVCGIGRDSVWDSVFCVRCHSNSTL